METRTWLDGRVTRSTLPTYSSLQPKPPSGPKRLQLGQGELAHFYDGEDGGIEYLAFLEFLPDGIRGNHLHQRKREYLYIIRGEVDLVVQDVTDPASREKIPLRAGDLAFITPGIAHALQTRIAGEGVEFSRGRFDPADVQAFALIEGGR